MTRWVLGWAGLCVGWSALAAQEQPASAPAATTAPAPASGDSSAIRYDDFFDRARRGLPASQRPAGPQAPGSTTRDFFDRDRNLEAVAPAPPPRLQDVDPAQERRQRNWLFDALDQAEAESRAGDSRSRDRDRDNGRESDRSTGTDPASLLGRNRDTSSGAGQDRPGEQRLSLMDLVRQEEARRRQVENRREDRERETAREGEEVALDNPPAANDSSPGAGQATGNNAAANASKKSQEDPAQLFNQTDSLTRLHQRLLFGSDSAAEAARSRESRSVRDNPYTSTMGGSQASEANAAEASWAAAAAVAARGTGGDGAGRFRSVEAEERTRRAVAEAAGSAVADLRPEERVQATPGPMAPLLPTDLGDPGVFGTWTPPPPVPEQPRGYQPPAISDDDKYFPQLGRF